jgi:hypothetical protein
MLRYCFYCNEDTETVNEDCAVCHLSKPYRLPTMDQLGDKVLALHRTLQKISDLVKDYEADSGKRFCAYCHDIKKLLTNQGVEK